MRKLWFPITLLAALLLTACGQAAAPAATPTPTLVPLPTTIPATCTVEGSLPPVDPADAARFAPVTDADWVLGPKDAKVTLLEYSDFQCPYCAMIAPVLEQVQKENAADVRVVYRHLPLPNHDKAMLGAQAAEAAGAQGKFWEMNSAIFAAQSDWVDDSVDAFRTWLIEQAGTLKLDVDKFTADMDSEETIAKVRAAQNDSQKSQVDYTPYLVINGRVYPENMPRDVQTISAIVKLIQMEDIQYTSCPEMTIDPAKQYTATLKTEKGDIVIQLLPDKAPMAVNSFVFLAREGWFNGITFHRVLPGFVAQTGDPTGTGFGGPGYAYGNEISDLRFDGEGVVGMANAGVDSNGSQFFITLDAVSNLDDGYTVFGRVISGMDVVKNLTPRDPQSGEVLPPGDKVIEVTITEK